MGKRVYQAEDGQIFESRAELDAYENQIALNDAFEGMGLPRPEVVTTELADAMTAALRPFVTKRTRAPRKSASNGTKRSRKNADAVEAGESL